MNYDDKHIKNVALLGASKAGMTTLVEAMHFESGATNRRGTTEEGTTISDYHEVEKAKGHSIYSQILHVDWRHFKINTIDVPGIDDFVAEVNRALRIADTAVVLVNAQNGVEAHTETIWREADRIHKPTVFVVNQLDHPQANWADSLNSLVDLVGNRVVPVQFPVQTGADFHEIVDAINMVMYRFPAEGGKPEKLAIPEEYAERAQDLHQRIVEVAATNEEELMEKFFETGNLSEEDLQRGLRQAMQQHEFFPVFCTSARLNMGSGRLMSFIDYFTPSPADLGMDPNGTTRLFVYKTAYEQNLGKVSYFKVMHGTVNSGDKLYAVGEAGTPLENMGQLYLMDGKNREAVQSLRAGDLGAAIKLKYAGHNDTLSSNENDGPLPAIEYPFDRIAKAVKAENPSDEEKLAAALKRMQEEDPSFRYSYDSEQGQMLIGCQGEFQLDTHRWVLENEFQLSADFSTPKVAYRETIARSASGFYRHKKQTGGAGQFGEVRLKVEPYFEGMPDPEGMPVRGREITELPWGGKLEVINSIVGGVIDARFIPSIQKGIIEAMEEGPIQQAPLRDVRVIVYDGKMHPVDSNDIAFKTAGFFAFRAAVADAKPQLLEPIMEVVLTMPEDSMGDVINEVQSRRGVVQNMISEGKLHKLIAHVPQANTFDLSTQLRSITHGQGSYRSSFQGLKAGQPAFA